MIDAYIKLLRLLALSALDAPEPPRGSRPRIARNVSGLPGFILQGPPFNTIGEGQGYPWTEGDG